MGDTVIDMHSMRRGDITNILLTIIILLGGVTSFLFQNTMVDIKDDVSFMRQDINTIQIDNKGWSKELEFITERVTRIDDRVTKIEDSL